MIPRIAQERFRFANVEKLDPMKEKLAEKELELMSVRLQVENEKLAAERMRTRAFQQEFEANLAKAEYYRKMASKISSSQCSS
ncbi:unnamed protein product [Caenorhabditis auriculariae]|uniref:Uncharacterized protein n=1 Tax=Caenorhabditis auriculariae TaxID=2777116 RepID=A0A8S1HR52_9PELO|nr:unnamed protein product [Caenorhabditis auriculariae]